MVDGVRPSGTPEPSDSVGGDTDEFDVLPAAIDEPPWAAPYSGGNQWAPPPPLPPREPPPWRPPPPPPGRRPGGGRFRHTVLPWLELVLVVVLAFGAAWTVQAFVIKPYRIPSGSMEETLEVGDRVLVVRFWYRFRDFHRGEVVVFHPPLRPEDEDIGENAIPPDVAELDDSVTYIKRVIGLPGEWVGSPGNGKVWICPKKPPGPPLRARVRTVPGCRALVEPYLVAPQLAFAFRRVPDGRLFVMGDNRDNSEDSRKIGMVPGSAVVGRAFVRYWPPQRIGGID